MIKSLGQKIVAYYLKCLILDHQSFFNSNNKYLTMWVFRKSQNTKTNLICDIFCFLCLSPIVVYVFCHILSFSIINSFSISYETLRYSVNKAITDNEIERRLSISLSGIFILKSSTQQIKQTREIKNSLTMTEYKNIFIWNTFELTLGTLIIKFQEVEKKTWFIKQEHAYIVINNCLCYNRCKVVKNLTNVVKIIVKAEKCF